MAQDVVGLVDLHIESLYILDERGRMVAVNDFEATPPPHVSIIRWHTGARCLLSAQLPEGLSRELEALAALEPVLGSPWPMYQTRYRELLASHAPEVREYGGPAFVLPNRSYRPDNVATVLSDDDRPLLEPHFGWVAAEFADARPVVGVAKDGAIVAVCRCARRKTAAVEAGVETAPAYRGRGFAKCAAARWSVAMHAANRMALYSTSWDNAASLSVAAALGAEQYAVDYNLT